MNRPWETRSVAGEYDTLAPDGSEIRLLLQLRGGSLVHCSLPPGGVTRAVRHRSVEELWYFLSGAGQVWRKDEGAEEITDVRPGAALTIPLGTQFQFRTMGSEPLTFVITTMPPWPGPDEAVEVPGIWPT
jgi:mannose-6-phosphate isomerase-like protein (cupin superfamily)